MTDEEGKFSVRLAPGYTYVIGVADRSWASDALTAMIGSDPEDQPALEIPAYPATPLRVTVTSGAGNQPLAGGRVQYAVRRQVALAPQYTAYLSIRKEKTLDEKGQVEFGAAAGEIELLVRHKNWATTHKVTVTAGQVAQVEIHAPAIGKRAVRGTVIAPTSRPDIDLANCEIQVFDRYFGTDIPATTSDEQGHWVVELDTHNVGIRATTADGKYSGLGFSDNLGVTAEGIRLRPTIKVSGRLVDEAGNPLPDVELVQYYDPNRRNSPTLRYLTTKSNAEGEFVFNSVITGIPQRLAVKIPRGGIRFVGKSTIYRSGQDVVDLETVYRDPFKRLNAAQERADDKKSNDR